MLKTRNGFIVLIFLIGMLASTRGAQSQEYIVMGTPLVNIRTGPSTDHVIVGRAEKGDIFKVIGKNSDWWEIAMFTADHRYVFSAPYVYTLNKAELVSGHSMELPDSEETKRSLYRSLQEAKTRAKREADEVIPPFVDAERNENFRRIMEDRIILEMLHIYGFQPALYNDLIAEGEKNGW
ncbi:SH3 domain-containing protein [bacterium]|nr:SH3 domain-containing protein [bacterium]